MSGATKISGELQAGTSGTTDSSAMETEEYYNPEGGEWSQKVDTGQLCRVCANPNEYLIPIFDGEGLEHELSVKIEKHLPIKVTETDALPQQMCYQCASTLIAWHDLVLNCVEADKKLRELQADEDDDDDDKGAEMFESHSMDSDPADEVDQPSTSESQITAKLQVPKKTVLSKDKKPKLKMVLVKGSLAGTSGQKTVAKTQVAKALELAKSKEGGNEDSASERWQQFRAYQQAQENFWAMSQWTRWYHGENAVANSEVTISEDFLDCTTVEHEIKEPVDTSIKYVGHVEDKLLKKHQEIIHEDRQVYECDQCGKRLASRENMRVHLRIHTGERPFTCHICGKQFQAPSGIKRHLKEVHEGVKEHICDICGRAFANKRTLEDHRRIHTGERPYVCDLCGKTFKTKASLYVHNKSHTDIFPFSCQHCDKRFRVQTSLSLHILKHTGEKPHACDICGKKFRIKYELGKHKLIHSEGKPFSCIICKHTFRQKKYLKNHMKTHHKDNADASNASSTCISLI